MMDAVPDVLATGMVYMLYNTTSVIYPISDVCV
jgi:hypothetical protein